MDYTIQSANISWVNIGPHCSTPRRMLQSHQFARSVRENRAQLDALLIRGPSPLLSGMASAADNLPVALLLVGDSMAGIDDLPQPRWRKEAIRLLSWWNSRQQLKVAQNALTFVNSHLLYQQLESKISNLHETRTTTLSEADFYIREDTCLQKPYRLLYTGRIDRAKGLFEMVESVALLVKHGEDVVLDLVGWPAKGDTILDELEQVAREKGITDRIIYHGFKAVGSDLFAYYKNADIYLIASQSSEGFPRTIWEAMAHSLPVIATNVGSIPLFLKNKDTAFLVKPQNSQLLAQAIETLLQDATLREKLIHNGRTLAKQNTLEKRATEMISILQQWIS